MPKSWFWTHGHINMSEVRRYVRIIQSSNAVCCCFFQHFTKTLYIIHINTDLSVTCIIFNTPFSNVNEKTYVTDCDTTFLLVTGLRAVQYAGKFCHLLFLNIIDTSNRVEKEK